MKFLIVMRHEGYIRNFSDAIRSLALRGHQVKLLFTGSSNKVFGGTIIENMIADTPVATENLPEQELRSIERFISSVRSIRDFLRYQHGVYAGADLLRQRMAKRVPVWAKRLTGESWFGKERVLHRLDALLYFIDLAVPSSRAIIGRLRKEAPDAILFTPLIDGQTVAVDYLKAAKTLGIPTGHLVASWDNLTNKGLIQFEPDRVFVWNRFQIEEGVTMHGIAPERMRMTGAQVFDEWFERKPATTYSEFASTVGLNAAKPFILYLCSSVFIARNEVAFIREWLKALRRFNDQTLQTVGVLIRPHPNNTKQWVGVDLCDDADVRVWPPMGQVPIDADSRAAFFDTLYHCSAVVGVNTSAMIEAGILGKAVYTIESPEFALTQSGTIHYRYLRDGGLLSVARSFDEHFMQVSQGLRNPGQRRERVSGFIRDFIRPFGLDAPGTPRLVAEIEQLGAMGQSAVKLRRPLLARVVGLAFSFVGLWDCVAKRFSSSADQQTDSEVESERVVTSVAFGAPTPGRWKKARNKSKKYR